jgi:hypothetical protein
MGIGSYAHPTFAIVDAENVSMGTTFHWTVGSQHTFTAYTPLDPFGDGSCYENFTGWSTSESGGGHLYQDSLSNPALPTQTITVPAEGFGEYMAVYGACVPIAINLPIQPTGTSTYVMGLQHLTPTPQTLPQNLQITTTPRTVFDKAYAINPVLVPQLPARLPMFS